MNANNLCLSFGSEVIYDNAEFRLSPRDKCGIVGVNGAGKTTLFRMITGEITPDAGEIRTDHARIGYLAQTIDINAMEATVWDYLLSGRPIAALERELQTHYEKIADDPDNPDAATNIARIQSELERLDCYRAEDALLELIDNMKIDPKMLDMRLCDLSGGQKSKVAFTRMLYSMPDILLLDEPTNHLDADTREFVINFLKKYRAMVLMVSHDRDFLNQTVNKILFVDKTTHKILTFDGNYDDYKRKSKELRRALDSKIESETRQIKKLNEFVSRAQSASPTNHSIKRMGKSRESVLKKILATRTIRTEEYKKIRLNLEPRTIGAKFPIEIDDLWFRYPGMPLMYRKLSFYITRGERFLIVGQNGVGKSTLLKLIMGDLRPERGEIKINPKTDIAYYAQELEQLSLDKTVLENVANDEYTDVQLRTVLSNFLFTGTDVFKKVGLLSPGQRARIALCRLLLKRANLLILDEPTNHLDPETQAIIGDNFRDYAGTIIMVSHNPDFVDQIGITRMLTLPSGHLTDYDHEKLEYYYSINTAE